MPESQKTKYSEFDEDTTCGSKLKNNQGCLLGAFFCFAVAIAVVIIYVTGEHTEIENNPFGYRENLMTDVYQSEPKWDLYKNDGNHQKFKTQFWNNKDFGSQIFDPINLKQSDGTVDELDNNVDAEL